jgi:hypothetical protein
MIIMDSRSAGVKHMSLEASYTLSRFDSFAQDQDFINNATDFDNLNHYYGPNALDRTTSFPSAASSICRTVSAPASPRTLIPLCP